MTVNENKITELIVINISFEGPKIGRPEHGTDYFL